VADGALSAEDESVGAGADAAVDAGVGAVIGAAEAGGRDPAGRAAATGIFFLATRFFGDFTACRLT
jgi:hypothetical protein